MGAEPMEQLQALAQVAGYGMGTARGMADKLRQNGRWIPGPGYRLFRGKNVLSARLPDFFV